MPRERFPVRKVVANDNTGKWQVAEAGCLLSEFDSESLAFQLASFPTMCKLLREVIQDDQDTGHIERSTIARIQKFLKS